MKEIIGLIYERAKNGHKKVNEIKYDNPDLEGVKQCNMD